MKTSVIVILALGVIANTIVTWKFYALRRDAAHLWIGAMGYAGIAAIAIVASAI